MKKLLMTAALVLTSTAQALSIAPYETVANYKFMEQSGVHYGSNNDATFHRFNISISDGKYMEIEVQSTDSVMRGPFAEPTPGSRTRTIRVSENMNDKLYKTIMNKVYSLANAKMKKYDRIHPICMMMPAPSMYTNHLSVKRDYDYDKKYFKKPLQVILGPQGCWVSNPIIPKNNYDVREARELALMLKTLALQELGDIVNESIKE